MPWRKHWDASARPARAREPLERLDQVTELLLHQAALARRLQVGKRLQRHWRIERQPQVGQRVAQLIHIECAPAVCIKTPEHGAHSLARAAARRW